MKEKIQKHLTKYIRFYKALLMAFIPLLVCAITCALQGYAIWDAYIPASDWNDELFYFKQVDGMVKYGFPYGYFGFNESHAEVLSFSQSIGQNKDGKEQTLEDTLGTDDDMLINDVLSDIKSEVVKNALNSLTSKERKIILLRYGLEKDKCKTLEEVGEIFGVTRERIRQTEEKALIKMRHPRNTRKLKDFIED